MRSETKLTALDFARQSGDERVAELIESFEPRMQEMLEQNLPEGASKADRARLTDPERREELAQERREAHPDLEREDIREALRYAAEAVKERALPLKSA